MKRSGGNLSLYYTVTTMSLFTTAGGWKMKLDYAVVFSRAKNPPKKTFQIGSVCMNIAIASPKPSSLISSFLPSLFVVFVALA